MITSEDLFQSIDTIVKKRLESVNYDTTVICRIIDNKQKNIGKYQVTNESITFEAYSDYSDYNIGDRVRVTIPNNDYNNKKWIEGKCDISEEDKIKIEDDINILSLSGNLVDIESTTNIQLKANDILDKQEINLNIPHNLFDLLANSQLYNAVKLSANFKVAPENILYDIETGCYGLELQLINKNGDIQSYILSSQDMVGDPYYFIISTLQQKDFILDNILLNEINQIKLYAFQDQQFKYVHNNNLQDVPIDYLPISISNIELSFGTTIHDKINKSVNIFSISDKDYNVGVTNSLKKTIGLFWNNLEGNNYIGFSDGINDKDYDENEYQSLIETSPDQKDNYNQRYCIYWYRYNPQVIENTDKFLTGKGWERIPDSRNIGLPIYETAEDAEYYTAQIDYNNDNNYLITELNKGRLVERYQAVLIYEHIIYKSNILEFTNTEIDSDYELTESITGFDLEHGANSRDTYLFYDETRKIKNKSDSLLNRCIQVKYKSLDGKDLLFVDGTIKWQIPKAFTMLEVGNIDNNMWVKEETADYYEYTGIIPTIEENETISIDYSKLIFQYKIRQEYSDNFNNNTITCVISKGNAAIELEQNLIFGQQGTNGTDYTITINSKDRVAVKRGEEGALPINIAFTNPEGENLEVVPNVHFIPSSYGPNILPFNYDSNSQTIIWNDIDETRLQNGIYGLIQVSCSYNNQILTVIEPIAFATNDNKEYYLEGNTTIIYDYNGTHPEYNRDTPYKLFDISNNQEITDLTWKLIFLDYEGKSIAAENYISPILTLTDSNCLKAAQMYSNEIQTTEAKARKYPVIQAINAEGKVIYSQSIYIDKNVYASTLLNNWDGQVQLKDSLYIAAPILMAGKKNIDNTFTGIVMGDLRDSAQYLSTGLYGFNAGELAYGFKTDGTAFIGASGQGRIEFDGTKGIIQSANYTSTTGMQIDLQSGLINAYNFKLNSANIQLNSNPAIGENYFYVGDNTKGYLQFIKTDTGNDFVLKLNSWLVEAGTANTNNYFYLGSDTAKDDTYKLIIGQNFKVSSAGDVIANGGTIGGIQINANGLTTEGLTLLERKENILAYLKYYEDSKSTEYSNTEGDQWNNNVYSYDDLKNYDEITIKPLGSGTYECFIIPIKVWDSKIDGAFMATSYHSQIKNNVSTTLRSQDIGQNNYLIINYNTTQNLEVSGKTKFSFTKTGLINSTSLITNLINTNTIATDVIYVANQLYASYYEENGLVHILIDNGGIKFYGNSTVDQPGSNANPITLNYSTVSRLISLLNTTNEIEEI